MTEMGGSIRRRRPRKKQRRRQGKGTDHDDGRRRERKPLRIGGVRGSGIGSRRVRIAGLVLLVVAVGFGSGYRVATGLFFPAPEPPPALQGVPDIRGGSAESAIRMLSGLGLVVDRVDSVRHPTADRGTVIGQTPLPGRTALPGARVRVTVSSGPEVRPVLDVTRLRGSRAAEVLSAGGFTVQVDTVDSDMPRGRVIGIEPKPGTELALPGVVRVRVSRGPPTFLMPDLTGVDEREALALLDSLGLVLSEMERRYSLRNVGAVFGQVPEPLSLVEKGTAVRLVVGEEVR